MAIGYVMGGDSQGNKERLYGRHRQAFDTRLHGIGKSKYPFRGQDLSVALGEMLLISQTYHTGLDCFLSMPLIDYFELMPIAVKSAEDTRMKLKKRAR